MRREAQQWTRLAFKGHEIKYRQKEGDVAGCTFTSHQVGFATAEEASANIFSLRPYEAVSSKEMWFSPMMQFAPDIAQQLLERFPDMIRVSTYAAYKAGNEICVQSSPRESLD